MQKHAPANTSARHLEQARFKASVAILSPFPIQSSPAASARAIVISLSGAERAIF
jgi:hypothetical protein